MRILVPVKRVADPNVRISVATDSSGVNLTNVRMAMSPFDEIAVEKAVRRRDLLCVRYDKIFKIWA